MAVSFSGFYHRPLSAFYDLLSKIQLFENQDCQDMNPGLLGEKRQQCLWTLPFPTRPTALDEVAHSCVGEQITFSLG